MPIKPAHTDKDPRALLDVYQPHEWRQRELGRFFTGYYERVPWDKEIEPIKDHFVHLAKKFPGQIAYTPQDTQGRHDMQTIDQPGRYLKKFYPHLSDDKIAELVLIKGPPMAEEAEKTEDAPEAESAPTKKLLLGEMFTVEELTKSIQILAAELNHTKAHERLMKEVVEPVIARINETTEQQNDISYIAYLLEYGARYGSAAFDGRRPNTYLAS